MAYLDQYAAPFRLTDGVEVLVRPIKPDDEPLLRELHESHSEHSIRMRFFSMVKHLSQAALTRLCNPDYDTEMALVAIHTDADRARIIGVSRYFLDPKTGVAEFAVIVGDAWQGHGLGWHLVERLIAIARQKGVRRLVGLVLRENQRMIQLTREQGFRIEANPDPTVVEVHLDLTPST